MKDLIERLESAEAGGGKLDRAFLEGLGWTLQHGRGGFSWQSPGGSLAPANIRPTTSVDDALALVPEGWRHSWHMGTPGMRNGYVVSAFEAMLHHDLSSGGGPYVEGFAETPALALCAAILKAREASQKD